MYLSFPELHKVSTVGIFVVLKSENKFDTAIINLMHRDKFYFVLNLIQQSIIDVYFIFI